MSVVNTRAPHRHDQGSGNGHDHDQDQRQSPSRGPFATSFCFPTLVSMMQTGTATATHRYTTVRACVGVREVCGGHGVMEAASETGACELQVPRRARAEVLSPVQEDS